MSDEPESFIAEPIAWPSDPAAAEAIRQYLIWLRSDGSEGAELGGPLDFRGANLTGIQMKWKFLWGSNFSGVILDKVDLYKSELIGATLTGASLEGARLHRTEMGECEAHRISFAGANLLKARISDSELTDSNFRDTYTGGAHLVNTDLRGSDFRSARFGGENPGEWTNLRGARMGGCQLAEASGTVIGPIDVGEDDTQNILSGTELKSWFSAQGAIDVTVG